jgi:hypothetical protein
MAGNLENGRKFRKGGKLRKGGKFRIWWEI